MLLHEVYYAQRDFRRTHERYARSIGELGLFLPGCESVILPPAIETVGDGYRAALTVSLPGGAVRELSIRYDSLVTVK
ncbi:MAG: hypothetical protein J7M24_02845 [Candidatus Latescibacteria bacterium]|nr:hypothetical protein [Candidatus Latescibacterota bacterium]